MKIGFFAIGIGHLSQPDLVKTVAVNAERLSFSTVWAPEHVVLLDKHISKYPYSKGEFPLPHRHAHSPIRSSRSPTPRPIPRASSWSPGFAWCPSTTRWCWPRWSRRSTS